MKKEIVFPMSREAALAMRIAKLEAENARLTEDSREVFIKAIAESTKRLTLDECVAMYIDLKRIADKQQTELAAAKARLAALIDSLEPAIHQVGVRIILSEDDRVAICAAIDAARGAK